jgi:hypothetical protein
MTYTPYQPKSFAQGTPKTMDRSIPILSPKHTASNPNLSLDFNAKNQFEPRNMDYRPIPMALSPNNQHTRSRHGDLARSLILTQQDTHI